MKNGILPSVPHHSIDYDHVGNEQATAATTSVAPGLLVGPSTATYGNGVDVASANYGDANASEGLLYVVEIPEVHPQNPTAQYDKTTAFAANDPIRIVPCISGKKYWVKGSSVTTTLGAKMVVTTGGLIKTALAHTASGKPVHMFVADQVYTSATWLLLRYIGIVYYFTANS